MGTTVGHLALVSTVEVPITQLWLQKMPSILDASWPQRPIQRGSRVGSKLLSVSWHDNFLHWGVTQTAVFYNVPLGSLRVEARLIPGVSDLCHCSMVMVVMQVRTFLQMRKWKWDGKENTHIASWSESQAKFLYCRQCTVHYVLIGTLTHGGIECRCWGPSARSHNPHTTFHLCDSLAPARTHFTMW